MKVTADLWRKSNLIKVGQPIQRIRRIFAKGLIGITSLLFATSVILDGLQTAAKAQITEAPNDAGTVVNRSGNTFEIKDGTQAGANLLHSFEKFRLDKDQIANFLSNPSIQNILGRVTGGDASVINGLIQVTGGNSNLYLINPAGIIFGPNARLDVPATFTATTANGIGLGDKWFNAVGTNDYASLVGSPSAFAFTQSGAIFNAGNLAVGSGQNLTLLGGTVINTGKLSAPSGNITIAAVPGEKLVRINQAGSLLSLALPVETKAAISPQPFTPLSLPQLLTGGNLSGATGVTVENGVVKLTGSGLQVETGDVVAKEITAQTATLSADNNLTLEESQIRTTGDLNLLARDTVRVRDSVASPVAIEAGRNLLIQGDGAIDIFALNHPDSDLLSGGDMVLRSASTVRGDAHYTAGGNLKFEKLDGSAGNLFSPYDPIILANGDVSLGDYTGASLHVLAGGSVTIGNVTIDSVGTAANTISPSNSDPFIKNLANVTRPDGNSLVIDGTTLLTLDIRAGIDWASLGGLPGGNHIVDTTSPPLTAATTKATGADITVNGNIDVKKVDGLVLLTNQYKPNSSLPGGAITVRGNITQTKFRGPDPGKSYYSGFIGLFSRGGITAGKIQTFSGETFSSAVVLSASAGDIKVTGIESGSGGIDVTTPGLFQVTGVLGSLRDLTTIVNPVPTLDIDAPENSDIKEFLTRQGVLNPDGSINKSNPNSAVITVDRGVRNVIVDVNELPVSIISRYENSQVGRIHIRHGSQAVPYSECCISISGAGDTQFVVGPQIVRLPSSEFKIRPRLKYQEFSSLTFSSDQFPNNVSGTVGAIVISGAGNGGLLTPLLNRPFIPIPSTGTTGTTSTVAGTGSVPSTGTTGTTSTVAGTDSVTSTNNITNTVKGTDTGTGTASLSPGQQQTAQRQLNAQTNSSACNSSNTVAIAPKPTDSRTADRSSRRISSPPATASSSCNTADDEKQILQILGEPPNSGENKGLNLESSQQRFPDPRKQVTPKN